VPEDRGGDDGSGLCRFTTVLGQRTRQLWILACLVRQHRAPVVNVVMDVGVSGP
jgi:hypothetical protein